MRLWFAASSEVPVYRQLATQVVLAIFSGELRPGDRLPSTRDLARRFGLHPNTISAGYRQLEREGWTEGRHGSGVYVRRQKETAPTPEQQLDMRIARFIRELRGMRIPPAVVRRRLSEWLASPPPERLVLVDPDAELRAILLAELAPLCPLPVSGMSIEECKAGGCATAAVYLCRPSKAAAVRSALPAGAELVVLPIRSANQWLAPWLPAPSGHLVGIVSRWPEFLSIARTMLVAAGLPPDALLVRDARRANWERGLDQASVILCDSLTRTLPGIPSKPMLVAYPLLADNAQEEIARSCDPAWAGL
ncbi:MAG TPA: GntR family transcriptional regulator [Acidobacteriaceae bacterium]